MRYTTQGFRQSEDFSINDTAKLHIGEKQDGGRCGDCAFFVAKPSSLSFTCSRTGREVGYLWQKPCFKKKEIMEEALNTAGTKVCKVCGRELPLDKFPRKAKARDGYGATCKECVGRNIAAVKKSNKEVSDKPEFPQEDKPGNCVAADPWVREKENIAQLNDLFTEMVAAALAVHGILPQDKKVLEDMKMARWTNDVLCVIFAACCGMKSRGEEITPAAVRDNLAGTMELNYKQKDGLVQLLNSLFDMRRDNPLLVPTPAPRTEASQFTDYELAAELRRRGYAGSVEKVKILTI